MPLGFVGERFVGASDEFAVVELRAGADERDHVWGVDRALAGLGGLDQLVGHGDSLCPGARPFGDLAAVAHGGEGRLGFVVRRWIQCPAGKS